MVAFSGFEATFALLSDQRFHLNLSGTGTVFTAIGLALVVVQVGIVGRVNDRLGESADATGGLLANGIGLAAARDRRGVARVGGEPDPARAGSGPDHADAVLCGARPERGRARGVARLAAVGRRARSR
jgi:hypothetical protein